MPATSTAEPSRETHLRFLQQALSLARLSPPKPTNFRVGCVIVSFAAAADDSSTSSSSSSSSSSGRVLSTGYTLEEEGNTHAEQNALAKLARERGIIASGCPSSSEFKDLEIEELLGAQVLTPQTNAYLYTSLEPCGLRLSGAKPCAERIIATRRRASGDGGGGGGIRKVIFGAREPGTFVQDSQALKRLDEAGVAWEYVTGMEEEILRVAKEGHVAPPPPEGGKTGGGRGTGGGTNVDDISPEERRRQEQQPRNPKKRMMEVDVSR